jgi:hypothetical protein
MLINFYSNDLSYNSVHMSLIISLYRDCFTPFVAQAIPSGDNDNQRKAHASCHCSIGSYDSYGESLCDELYP